MQLSTTRAQTHRLRFLPSPYYDALCGARLERIIEAEHGGGREITLELIERRPVSKAKLAVADGQPTEHLRVVEVPRRIRFPLASWYKRLSPFDHVDSLTSDDSRRTLYGLRRMRHPQRGDLFVVEVEEGMLALHAPTCILEDWPEGPRAAEPNAVDLRRPWAHVPPNPVGLVPVPAKLHAKYAGDPIAIQLRGRRYRERFFIGGMRHQPSNGRRPEVDAVLNLCEMPNAWLCGGEQHERDRWACKGEGRVGMRPAELVAEAEWVAERLRAGQRVLVHCYAGLNRSSTVCCAALILLEGLSAGAALARVREHHPEAWPDPYHWLALRWLATTSGSATKRLATLTPRTTSPSRHRSCEEGQR